MKIAIVPRNRIYFSIEDKGVSVPIHDEAWIVRRWNSWILGSNWWQDFHKSNQGLILLRVLVMNESRDSLTETVRNSWNLFCLLFTFRWNCFWYNILAHLLSLINKKNIFFSQKKTNKLTKIPLIVTLIPQSLNKNEFGLLFICWATYLVLVNFGNKIIREKKTCQSLSYSNDDWRHLSSKNHEPLHAIITLILDFRCNIYAHKISRFWYFKLYLFGHPPLILCVLISWNWIWTTDSIKLKHSETSKF